MRRLFIGGACVAALVLAAPAQAAFTGVKTPEGGAVLEGDGASDTVELRVVGGFVEHNLSGFASARDFDSGNGGEQTVTDAALSRVVVNGNGGTDVLRVVEDGGGDVFWAFSPACILRDPGRPSSGALFYPGDGVNEAELCYGNGTDSAEVIGGGGKDQFLFLDTKQGVDVSLDGRGGDDWVGYGGFSGPHAVRSFITFTGGDGADEADMLDQRGTPATYEMTQDAIKRNGYFDFRLGSGVELAWVYATGNADTVTVTGSREVQVWAGGGDDLVDATAATGFTSIRGEDGNDRMLGGRGRDVLFAGPGNDVLDPGPGVDNLLGGDGDDTLNTRDGEADAQLDCDAGTDTVEGDALDERAARNCERTTFRDGAPPGGGGGGGGGGADAVAPVVSSPKLSRKTFRVGRRGRTVARLTLRSTEAAKLTARFQRRICKLKPGRYKLLLDVKDAAGNKGKRRTLSLTVKR